MPVITRLVQGKKNPNRVNLYLDGEFAFALGIDEVARQSLKKGLELSTVQIESLKETDESQYIFAKILNFLSYRPRSVKEVRDRLYKYGVRDTAQQDEVISRLERSGYLGDLEFAKWFIASRNNNRPRSIRMLSQELKAKGIAREVIDSVINEITDEETTMIKLVTKKLGPHRSLENLEKQKIYAYLSRLGFTWSKIKEVVKHWESE